MRLFKASALFALAALLLVPAALRAQVESTPIPAPQKPDLSPLAYRIGTFTCSTLSSRRPRAFTTTYTYTMDPSGYWINGKTTVAPMSWFPRGRTGQEKITYDNDMKRWVDISWDELGGYGYVVSTGGSGSGSVVWHDLSGTTGDPSIASQSDITETKTANGFTQKSSFQEKSGRTVTVTTTCTKA